MLHEHRAHIFWGRWRPFFTLARSQKPMMIRFLTRCEGSHRGQTLGSALACTVENMCSKWLLAHSSPRASSQWGLWPLNEKRSLKKLTDSAFILRLQECTFDVENCFFCRGWQSLGVKNHQRGHKVAANCWTNWFWNWFWAGFYFWGFWPKKRTVMILATFVEKWCKLHIFPWNHKVLQMLHGIPGSNHLLLFWFHVIM